MFRGGATTRDGKKLIMFGLTKKNIERLQNDEPIAVPLDQWGITNTRVVIFAGDTEESIVTDLLQLVGPDTKIDIDPRLFNRSQ